MKTLLRPHIAAAVLIAAMGLIACDDDNGPTGPGDDSPPAVATVSATDANHINLQFNEAVDRESAEVEANYAIIATNSGDPLPIVNASLKSDQRTVVLTTGEAMAAIGYTVGVDNVVDVRGNAIETAVEKTFNGSTTADNTAPEIVRRAPDQNATNIARTTLIEIDFSEPVSFTTFNTAFALEDDGTPVPVTVTTDDDVHFSVQPTTSLAANTIYSVTLIGVADGAGNIMNDTQWGFKTTGTNDNTGPTLVSTVPTNNATNVATSSTISMTFSEPIDSTSFVPVVDPAIGGAPPVWSNGGRTATFTPEGSLSTDTQYTITLVPGTVADQSGNTNSTLITLVFTTGAALESGRISGSIAGAAAGPGADPSGAFVVAASADPLAGGDYVIRGIATVQTNNTYVINRLAAGTYFPFVVMDTNEDGVPNPLLGDAIGAYGANLASGDMDPDSVVVSAGGNVIGINFALHDPTAITGAIQYGGAFAGGSYPLYVGLFNPTGWDPGTSPPVLTVITTWPGTRTYAINSLQVGTIPNGNYLVAAFIDVNSNTLYDEATEPFGVFGGESPDAINIAGGSDAPDTNLFLDDPPPLSESAGAGSLWKVTTVSSPTRLARLAGQIFAR